MVYSRISSWAINSSFSLDKLLGVGMSDRSILRELSNSLVRLNLYESGVWSSLVRYYGDRENEQDENSA